MIYIVSEAQSPSSKRAFFVSKYSEGELVDRRLVYQKEDGSWFSDDLGFIRHRTESASRLIRIVKEHIEKDNPVYTAYWFEGKSTIKSYAVKRE